MAKLAWCYLTAKQGTKKIKVKVDRKDLDRISKYSWRVTEGTTGRLRVVTSLRTPKGVRTITLGKFLMNPPRGKQVYSRRFNEGLDYRKENLVVCTLKERQRLLPKNRMNVSSKYRGVSFSKSTKKWRAGIEVDGKAINLGYFKFELDAAAAYNDAAKKYFGAMAYENPIGRKIKKRKH